MWILWGIRLRTIANGVSNRQQKDQKPAADGSYTATLDKLPTQVESIQDFWRYCNNTPFDQIKMRESIYLFKQGFQPVWEDRRNINGGSWTFRVPKQNGPDFFTRVQLMAIGEKLQGCLESGKRVYTTPSVGKMPAPLYRQLELEYGRVSKTSNSRFWISIMSGCPTNKRSSPRLGSVKGYETEHYRESILTCG